MITETQKLLLGILASQLFQRELPSFENADWNLLLKEAEAQAVLPLTYAAVENALPDDVKRAYTGRFYAETANNVRSGVQHGKLHELLTENGVPYVFIKGIASASYYPAPELRMMGDVDFLVRSKDLDRAKEVLLQAGYETSGEAGLVHLSFHKPKETLEMHWEPGGIPDGEKGDLCRSYLGDIIESEIEYKTENGITFIPDAFHHGLVILLHTANHMINTGIGLRHLCDWAVFAGHFSDGEFTELFREKLENAGLWQFARLLTAVSVRYLGCPEKKWAAENAEEELLEEIIADILDSGNLGKKDVERINEAKLYTTDSTGTVDGSKHGLFRAITEKAYKTMPVCKRVKILLPVGQLVVIVRHLGLVLRGKRPKIHLKKMVQNADQRRSVYARFRLFQ